MTASRTGVVFDCVVFAQALINDSGPAAACLGLARSKTIRLYWSDYVIAEILQLPDKLPTRLRVTSDRIDALIQDVAMFAEMIDQVPDVYQHPIDVDDSHYINLAIASGATLITSRDHHLLDLMDDAKQLGRDFRLRFPHLSIVLPEHLLDRIRNRENG